MQSPERPASVVVLAFPDTSASVVYGMYDLFHSAGRDWGLIVHGAPGAQVVHARVAAAGGRPLVAANGVRIVPQAAIEDLPAPDIVCVPEITIPPGEPPGHRFDAEIAFLRRCYAAGSTLATACSGALLLAEAGLLDGEEATTHWAWCDAMRERYPTVKLHAERALVVAGDCQRLLMAGGGTTWLDLVLYLLARHAGTEVAMQTARINLIDWHAVGQQPFARLARTRQVEDAVIARCQGWIAQHYAEPAPVAAMVRLSGLAERSFKRRFQQATGMSPLEYVHTLRLEEAKHLLETGDQPVEAVAAEVGYEDAGFFSRLFRRKVNLTPAQYRRRFGALRQALATSTGNAA